MKSNLLKIYNLVKKSLLIPKLQTTKLKSRGSPTNDDANVQGENPMHEDNDDYSKAKEVNSKVIPK